MEAQLENGSSRHVRKQLGLNPARSQHVGSNAPRPHSEGPGLDGNPFLVCQCLFSCFNWESFAKWAKLFGTRVFLLVLVLEL